MHTATLRETFTTEIWDDNYRTDSELADAFVDAIDIYTDAETLVITRLLQFERRGIHLDYATNTVTTFLKAWGGTNGGLAARWVRSANLCATHPIIHDLFKAGKLTVDHLDLLSRARKRHRSQLFDDHLNLLLDLAEQFPTAADFARVLKHWTNTADDLTAQNNPDERYESRHLHTAITLYGMMSINGLIDETGAPILKAALDHLSQPDPTNTTGEPRPHEQRYADALIELARRYLQNCNTTPNGTTTPICAVDLVITADLVAEWLQNNTDNLPDNIINALQHQHPHDLDLNHNPDHPDHDHPDRDHPDRDHPDRDHPDRDHPDRDHPDRDHPDRDHPDRDHPDRDHPDRDHPDRDHPDRDHPDHDHPDHDHPDRDHPDRDHPDRDHPGHDDRNRDDRDCDNGTTDTRPPSHRNDTGTSHCEQDQGHDHEQGRMQDQGHDHEQGHGHGQSHGRSSGNRGGPNRFPELTLPGLEPAHDPDQPDPDHANPERGGSCPCDLAGREPAGSGASGSESGDGHGYPGTTANDEAWLGANPDDLLHLGRQILGTLGFGPEILNYGPVRTNTAQYLLCDAWIGAAIFDTKHQPLVAGRQIRLFNRAQRRLLAIRDGGCVWPGCDKPLNWCQVHHLTPWQPIGETNIDNGAHLCTHHHILVHHGWNLWYDPHNGWTVSRNTPHQNNGHRIITQRHLTTRLLTRRNRTRPHHPQPNRRPDRPRTTNHRNTTQHAGPLPPEPPRGPHPRPPRGKPPGHPPGGRPGPW